MLTYTARVELLVHWDNTWLSCDLRAIYENKMKKNESIYMYNSVAWLNFSYADDEQAATCSR